MAYTYVNKKTGDVIYLNRRAKTAFWEEQVPEEETPEEESIEEESIEEESIEEVPTEEPKPKKTTKSRGK